MRVDHIASRLLARRRSRASSRAVGRGLLALVAAVTLLASFAAGPAQAADDLLRLAVATTYRVDPADAVVHVTLDVRATNLKPSTATTFFYFDTLSFGIQPEARSISATQNGRALSLTARPRDGYRQIVVKTPRLLFRQPTLTRITFDLPSGEPRSDSAIRVGRAHTRFPIWAWGDIGAGRRPGDPAPRLQGRGPDLPARYRSAAPLAARQRAADLRRRRHRGPEPLARDRDAANRNALTDVRLDLPDKAVTIHAWPEDKEWLARVTDVLKTGLPDLEDGDRSSLAGDRRARRERGVVGRDRGLCRSVRRCRRRDPDQRGARRAGHRPRGGPRLVRRQAVRPALDQRGARRGVRGAGGRRQRRHRPARATRRSVRSARAPSGSTRGRRRRGSTPTPGSPSRSATTRPGRSSPRSSPRSGRRGCATSSRPPPHAASRTPARARRDGDHDHGLAAVPRPGRGARRRDDRHCAVRAVDRDRRRGDRADRADRGPCRVRRPPRGRRRRGNRGSSSGSR